MSKMISSYSKVFAQTTRYRRSAIRDVLPLSFEN